MCYENILDMCVYMYYTYIWVCLKMANGPFRFHRANDDRPGAWGVQTKPPLRSGGVTKQHGEIVTDMINIYQHITGWWFDINGDITGDIHGD